MLSLNVLIQIVIHLLILPIRTIHPNHCAIWDVVPTFQKNMLDRSLSLPWQTRNMFNWKVHTNKPDCRLSLPSNISVWPPRKPQVYFVILCCEKNMPSDSEDNFLVLTERTFKLQSHHNTYQGSSITLGVLPLFVVNSTSCPMQFNLLFFIEQSWANPGACLRCGSMAAHLLELWVRIPPGAWMSASCECCVLSGVSALGWSLIQRCPAECGVSNWMWMWSLNNEEPWPTNGCCAIKKIEQSQSTDFQLPSSPCTIRKYLLPN